MNTRLLGPIAVSLGDDKVEARYRPGLAGAFATLVIGDTLSLHVSDSSPATLRRLAEVATELAAWQERQDDAEPDVAAEVDAEDGVERPVYTPFKRDEVAA
jgi:hypothetical protein